MAKKSTKAELKSTTAPAPEVMDDLTKFATDLRQEFYLAFKRQPTISLDETKAVINANASEQEMAAEWWFEQIKKAEKAKGIATPRVETTNAIIDILSKDNELTDVTSNAAAAGDLPPRAPAHVAFMLVRDHATQFNGDTAKARQFIVDTYADPGSKQKDSVDGWGVEIGENARTDYFWDWADYGAGVVSWYAEKLVDCLPAGIAINKSLVALQDRADTTIEFDGVALNPATMAPAQRTKALEQLRNRRTRLINIHRDAVDVIRQWQEIKARLGEVVTVTWAWLDDANTSMGLIPTKAIIVVRNIIQDGENKGMTGTAFYPYTAAQFINLSVDGAIHTAGKAGRDRVSILDLVGSKREKKQTVSAGSKLAKAKRAAEEAAKVSADRIPDWFSKMYDWTVTDGNWSALRAKLGHMKQADLRLFLFHVVKVTEAIDKQLITPDAQRIASEVDTEITIDQQKELDAKATAKA